ncbi:hypothetical protein ACFX13_002439 [Malus domestica]
MLYGRLLGFEKIPILCWMMCGISNFGTEKTKSLPDREYKDFRYVHVARAPSSIRTLQKPQVMTCIASEGNFVKTFRELDPTY